MCKFFTALLCYYTARNYNGSVAQGFGATHIVSNRYHSVSASIVQFVKYLHKFAKSFIVLPYRRLVQKQNFGIACGYDGD